MCKHGFSRRKRILSVFIRENPWPESNSVTTFSVELARECSCGREAGTKQHHRGGLGILRNLGRGWSHDPESWSLMDRRAKSSMFPIIVFKIRREQVCRVRDPLNIDIGQLAESEMLSIIVFKMADVLVFRIQNTLNIKIDEVVSFGKDKLFKRQVTVSPVGPGRSNQRQAKHGTHDAGQKPWSSHVLVPKKKERECFPARKTSRGLFCRN